MPTLANCPAHPAGLRARAARAGCARGLRGRVAERYPGGEGTRLVQDHRDHRNTHTAGARCEIFPPAEARRILARLEVHDTPQQGSGLNPAEIKPAMLARGGRSRRVADTETLPPRGPPRAPARHDARWTIRWRFTPRAARPTLHALYPDLNTQPD